MTVRTPEQKAIDEKINLCIAALSAAPLHKLTPAVVCRLLASLGATPAIALTALFHHARDCRRLLGDDRAKIEPKPTRSRRGRDRVESRVGRLTPSATGRTIASGKADAGPDYRTRIEQGSEHEIANKATPKTIPAVEIEDGDETDGASVHA